MCVLVSWGRPGLFSGLGLQEPRVACEGFSLEMVKVRNARQYREVTGLPTVLIIEVKCSFFLVPS